MGVDGLKECWAGWSLLGRRRRSLGHLYCAWRSRRGEYLSSFARALETPEVARGIDGEQSGN